MYHLLQLDERGCFLLPHAGGRIFKLGGLMTCNVVLSAKEFRKFTFFDIIRRRKMYKSPVTFSLILLISALICFLLHDIDGAIMLGTLLLVVGLGVPIVYFSTFHLSLNKQVKLQSLKEPRKVYTVSLSRGGIDASNATENVSIAWDEIHHIYKTKSALYLYYTQHKAFILPFSCFDVPPSDVWNLITSIVEEERRSII